MKAKKYVHEDLIMSLFFIAFSISFMVQSRKLTVENRVFPLLFTGIMLILSIYALSLGIKKTIALNRAIAAGEDVKTEVFWGKLKGPVISTLLILAYLIGIKYMGFCIPTAIFMPVFMIVQNYKKPIPILCVTVGMELVVYFVFLKILALNLPTGWPF